MVAAEQSRAVAVLAGNRFREAMVAGNNNKSLLTVGDSTCLEHVLSAIDQSTSFDSCVVVGPVELHDAIDALPISKPVELVGQGDSLAENMRRATAAAELGPDERMCMMTADIPLVTARELDRFAELTEGSQADAVIAFAHGHWQQGQRDLMEHYRRSMIVARGGPYLHGNLFAIRQNVLDFAKLIELGRAERRQSSVGNILLAFPTFLSLGIKAGPALLAWLRLVAARAIWLRRGRFESVPNIAPSLGTISATVTRLASGKVSVEIVDIGAEGACFDIDNEEQLEAIRELQKGRAFR